MRRLALALLAILPAVAASASDLHVRVVVYQRIPHLVNGDAPESKIPSVVLAAPEGGWPDSLDAIRGTLSDRLHIRREVMITQILAPKELSTDENSDFFIPEIARAIEVKQEGDNLKVTLPKGVPPVVVPASGTSIIAGTDEQLYIGITVKPKFVDDVMVIMNGAPPLKIVSRVEPEYPKIEALRNRTGQFFTQLKVEKDGSVSAAQVLDHVNPEIDAAAAAAYKQWRFEPPMHNGKPVTAYMIMFGTWRVE